MKRQEQKIKSKITEFKKAVYDHYKKEGRSFPWRENTDPWGILVSELMLQQTQTERVMVYWTRWMKKWPTAEALHKATLEEALKEWNGLGYNRRCRFVKDCARIVTTKLNGQLPRKPYDLIALPGIGPYTAGAIACFAYNFPSVFIETNIRAAVIHFFFQDEAEVEDRQLVPILEEALDRRDPRTWYWALMDYGAALKKLTPNPNRRSAHYSRQNPFEGSFRQIRGSLVRSLLAGGPLSAGDLRKKMDIKADEEDIYKALDSLKDDFLVAEKAGVYQIRE
ncbi:endonuclease III [Spirochaetia bacterium]|nr:endonuclease III [Spirochaetia bacterium]